MSFELYNKFRGRRLIGADKEIAEKIGINAAIVLNRIIWSCGTKEEKHKEKYFIDGHWWMVESISSFSKNLVLGVGQIRAALGKLLDASLIETKFDSRQPAHWPKMYRPLEANIWVFLGIQNSKPVVSNQHTWVATSAHRMYQTNKPVVSKQQTGCEKIANPSLYSYSPLRVFLESTNMSQAQFTTSAPGTACIFPDENKSPDISEDRKNIHLADEKGPSGTELLNKKKGDKKGLRKPRTKKIEYSSKDLDLGRRWYDRTVQRLTSPHKSWSPEYFAENIAKVRKKSGLSEEVLVKLVEFCIEDHFWSKNCLSPASLLNRSQKTGLLKIDSILNNLITKTDMEVNRVKNMGVLTPEQERELNPFL